MRGKALFKSLLEMQVGDKLMFFRYWQGRILEVFKSQSQTGSSSMGAGPNSLVPALQQIMSLGPTL